MTAFIIILRPLLICLVLRLDNTGAGVIEVNPILLDNHTTDTVDLYIK